jgi:competence protein ComEC
LEPVEPGPDLRLLPAAGGAWALTWWATGQRATLVLIVAVVLVVSVGVLLGFRFAAGCRSRHSTVLATVTLLVAVLTAVLAVTGLRLLQRERDPLTRAAIEKLNTVVTGRVSGDPRRLTTPSASGEDRYAVRIAVGTLTVRGRTVPSSAGLVVLGGPAWGILVAGSHVRLTGRLGPVQPGDSASAIVFPRGSPVLVDPGNWIWRVAERLREGLRFACRGLPSDARGLLPALVVGDTSSLSPQLRADLQTSGLSHLTSVSGANVSIIAAAAVLIIAGLGGGRRLRSIGTALAIMGFVVLARPEPSVLRAAVMGGLALIGLLQARRGAGMPLLSATAVVLLVVDPWLSRSYGFILSVLATAGLLLLVPVWLRRSQRWPRAVVLALAVPVAAQLATAPVTVLLNPSISLVSVPANLLVAAAVAPATIAGVGAAAISPLSPTGAELAAFVGGLATGWIALVAHRAAALPGASLPWPAGRAGALLLAVLIGAGLAISLRRSWLVVGLAGIAVAACLIAPRVVAVLSSKPGWPPSDWAIVQCDVGQGSATLIRSGPDRALLVDAGPDPKPVDNCLDRAGVNRLDLIVITHFHADHAGGLRGAIEGRGSPPIVVSSLAEPDDQVREVRAIAAADRAPVVTAAPGMHGQAGGGDWTVRWRLLPPRGPGSSPPEVSGLSVSPGLSGRALRAGGESQGTEINNASVVVFAEVQGLRVMALGDVEPEAQRPLVRTIQAAGAGVLAPVDVVVVAHHGSARQEPRLYRLLGPRVALIGVGVDNDYGHPAPSAMTLLKQVGAVALRTDQQGQLAVSGPADRLRVLTSK